MAKHKSSSLSPDLTGATSDPGRDPRKSGGGGGGGKKKFDPGASGFLAPFSDTNEAAGLHRVVQGLKRGQKVAKKALKTGEQGFGTQYSKALDAIGTSATGAIGDITSATGKAVAGYDPYVQATEGAAGSYADALGLNGPAGHDRSVEQFQATPGYEFALESGLDALDRRAASRGMLASGNTTDDTLTFAHGLSDLEYGKYLDRLAGEQDVGVGVAGSLSGIYGNQGVNTAGIRTDAGTRTAGVRTALGGQKYAYGQDVGNLGYKTQTGIGNARSGFLTGKDQTGQNIFGAAAGVANIGAQLTGFGGGGGNTGYQPKYVI